jgi:hypothetical protein
VLRTILNNNLGFILAQSYLGIIDKILASLDALAGYIFSHIL